jgi:hypothetical protein
MNKAIIAVAKEYLTEVEENGAYYASIKDADSYGQYKKKKLRHMGLILNLASRSTPLANFVYLNSIFMFTETLGELAQYQPKRGKKPGGNLPIKAIIKVLGCSRRTAQTYYMALRGLETTDIFNAGMFALIDHEKEKLNSPSSSPKKEAHP